MIGSMNCGVRYGRIIKKTLGSENGANEMYTYSWKTMNIYMKLRTSHSHYLQKGRHRPNLIIFGVNLMIAYLSILATKVETHNPLSLLTS